MPSIDHPVTSLIACHDCDAVYQHLAVSDSESAHCRRCGAKLYTSNGVAAEYALALSIAGIVLYLVMVSFPFLGISVNGISRNISLFDSIGQLFHGYSVMLAALVALVLVVVPLLKVTGLTLLLVSLVYGVKLPGVRTLCKLVEKLIPWNMTEIYLVGIIVTFVKVTALASVVYGVAFWAFIGFVVVMTWTISILDFVQLWSQLDLLSRRQES